MLQQGLEQGHRRLLAPVAAVAAHTQRAQRASEGLPQQRSHVGGHRGVVQHQVAYLGAQAAGQGSGEEVVLAAAPGSGL